MKSVRRWGRLEFILAAYLCIPPAPRVRSQAVGSEASPGKNWGCIINLSQFTLWQIVQNLLLSFFSFFLDLLYVSFLFPLALTSLAFWSLEAGGVAGQSKKRKRHRSCQSQRAQKTEWPGPAGQTGRWLPQDNDQVTSAEWTSHQANRLTLTHQGSQAGRSPPPPPPVIPSGYTHSPRSITQVYWFTKFHKSPKKEVWECPGKKKH